jgi:hypothetical protein
MTFVKKPIALACFAVAAVALSAFAQTSQLNPTVKVLSRPQSPVPAECANPQVVYRRMLGRGFWSLCDQGVVSSGNFFSSSATLSFSTSPGKE